jgi:hypothetical protein
MTWGKEIKLRRVALDCHSERCEESSRITAIGRHTGSFALLRMTESGDLFIYPTRNLPYREILL